MNSLKKTSIILISISLFSSILFGIDKSTASNPNDTSLIRIGLSNLDSNICSICQEDGLYFNSGCKRCIQDSIVIVTHVNDEKLPYLGWSNDNGIAYGDKNCSGNQFFKKISINENSTYWVEIIKDDLDLQSNFYADANFSQKIDSAKLTMCSNPIDLQYLRISNEDGKPSGNGGKLFGNIDDFEIKHEATNNQIFSTSFENCNNKSCDNIWTLNNQNRIFIDSQKENITFFSEVSGTNDYATLQLAKPLPDSWELKFKLHIDELEEHPRGKGLLKIDPSLRQIFLGIPALIFPLVSFGITRKIKSNIIGILIISAGILISCIVLFNTTETSITNLLILGPSVLIIILGIFKLDIRMKKEKNEINK